MTNKDTLKSLHIRPIAFYPIYTEITGSTTAGIVLSQLMFWLSKKDKIYKTDAEIKAETYLKDNELRAAKKKIKSLDFIAVTVEGIPAKTYYAIDWELYQTSMVKFTKQEELNSLNSDSEIHETITKTTTKTTTKSKKNIQKKEVEFSFSLKKLTSYDNLPEEYTKKLYGACMLIDGNLDRYEEFINTLRAKGYEYKNFPLVYMNWDKEKNYKNFEPEDETELGDNWKRILLGNGRLLAVNTETYETKEGMIK